jgi:aldehyde:ferredoxin oxidoreductase
VMGSKQLKAVVVRAAGPRKVTPEFRTLCKAAHERVRTFPALDWMKRWGTSSIVGIKNVSGDLPSRNHQRGQVPFIGLINAEAVDKYVVRPHACHACGIHCGRDSVVPDGPYACSTGGPEYETIDALGPMVWNSNLEALIYANWRCNELGLDTISTGATMAFAMECHQRGLLDDPELSLEWGDVDSIVGMIERIGSRSAGLGNLLAEGTKRAALEIGQGAEAYAMQVKGLEMTRQEPRIAKGMGLGHVTSNRGPDHLYGLPTVDLAAIWDVAREYFPAEILDELMDTSNETYKPDLLVLSEHFCALSDSLGVCKFTTPETWCFKPRDLAEALGALQGRTITESEMLAYGERIVNVERLYNVRQGMSRADDRLPKRFTTEPLDIQAFEINPETGWGTPAGKPARAGAIVRDLDAMLDRYYMLRGWSPNGVPTLEKAGALGLAAHAAAAGVPE